MTPNRNKEFLPKCNFIKNSRWNCQQWRAWGQSDLICSVCISLTYLSKHCRWLLYSLSAWLGNQALYLNWGSLWFLHNFTWGSWGGTALAGAGEGDLLKISTLGFSSSANRPSSSNRLAVFFVVAGCCNYTRYNTVDQRRIYRDNLEFFSIKSHIVDKSIQMRTKNICFFMESYWIGP